MKNSKFSKKKYFLIFVVDDLEFKYNTARNYQFLGYNSQAYSLYTQILEKITHFTTEQNENSKIPLVTQIQSSSAYNLSILIKRR